MKYIAVLIVVLGIGISTYWWLKADPSVTEPTPADITEQPDKQPVATDTAPAVQTYQNDEWGIAFEYPNDWEIREPAFYSTVSKLNLSVEPKKGRKYPETILVNITQKDWMEKAMLKMKSDGIVFEPVLVANFDAFRFESSYEGLPQIDYLILVNDSYWINIAGKKEYEDVLNQMLASFTITPVELPAAE
jgi:hypothetical protein